MTATLPDHGDSARPGRLVTVAVCTYRRPEALHRLLAALERLTFPRSGTPEVAVVVVDNSPEGDAHETVALARSRGVLHVTYVPLGAGNISVARNAALDAAAPGSEFVALIDDDEVPEPMWLDELLVVADRTRADIVCGPVLPAYPEGAPSWLRRDDFFAVTGFPDGAELTEGITGNALLRTAAISRLALSFDATLGLSGGEDQLFFRSAWTRGARLRWAARAVAHEDVPQQRLSVRYLMRREYRKGNTLGLLDRGGPGWPVGRPVRRAAGAGFWALTGTVAAVRALAGRHRSDALAGALRVVRAVGMVVGLAGHRYDHYSSGTGSAHGRPLAAFVTSESPFYQAAGHSRFLGGLVDHARSMSGLTVVVVTTNRVGFLVRRADADGLRFVAPGVRRIGGLDVVVSPSALASGVAWRLFRAAPRQLQGRVDALRTRLRSGRGVDHHLGTRPDAALSAWISQRLAEQQPEAVFFWTLWSLPQPLRLPTSVRAPCVLTSDVMWQRADALRAKGYRVTPSAFGVDDERALLASVPAVVAIQWDDAEEFRRLAPDTEVLVSPVAFTTPTRGRRADPDRCLFVGSGSLPNVDGLRWFLDECWAGVRRARPEAELHVVGTVCARIGAVPDGVVLRGEVSDLDAEHARAAAVVVPLQMGSGLKIKIVEAICHGVPVITTSVGAQGLMALEPRPFVLADDPDDFAGAVARLLGDLGASDALAASAREQATLFTPERAYQEIDAYLERCGVQARSV
ncbi:glycosyltransferase [uncultured Cellulomonas sp.]|uniref:glycosyltransferase n=1 Tax=uncultured Cellulomonas sp. TaxID=189682 RepID=UPI00260F4F43|nr:glycosyltransferase [uncultured Cellulomonas sp.]